MSGSASLEIKSTFEDSKFSSWSSDRVAERVKQWQRLQAQPQLADTLCKLEPVPTAPNFWKVAFSFFLT